MTDRYSGPSFSDPQSQNISYEHSQQSKRKNADGSYNNPNAAHSWEDDKALEAAQDAKKLLKAVVGTQPETTSTKHKPAALIRQAEGRGEAPFIAFFADGLWRTFGDSTQETTTLFERYGFTRSQFSKLMRDSIITKATLLAEEHEPVEFNPPSNSIFYRNGVYDWDEQQFRSLRVEDRRTVKGEGLFDNDATDEDKDCVEVITHVKMMAGGDENKARLIHCVNALNIVGVQTLGSTFKTSIFLWVCPEGNGGRTSLFKVIKRASGQNVVQFDHAEQLTDPNKLLQLEGKNAIYIDERQVATSAKAHWVSILKQIVGGDGELTTKRLYSDISTTRGQWTFNQATNSTEFLHGCDKALFDRFVAIKTTPFKDEDIEAYAADPTRSQQFHSCRTASSYVKWLRKNFGTLREIAAEVSRLRKLYTTDIEQVADQKTAYDDFFDKFIDADSNAKPIKQSVLFLNFKKWAEANHPNSRMLQQLRQFSQALHTRYGNDVGKNTSTVHGDALKGQKCLFGHSFNIEAVKQESDIWEATMNP